MEACFLPQTCQQPSRILFFFKVYPPAFNIEVDEVAQIPSEPTQSSVNILRLQKFNFCCWAAFPHPFAHPRGSGQRQSTETLREALSGVLAWHLS